MSLYGEKRTPAEDAPTALGPGSPAFGQPGGATGGYPPRPAADGHPPAGQGGGRRGAGGSGGLRGRLSHLLATVGRRRVLIAAGVAIVLIAVSGTVAYAYAGDVPRGTTVLGVDLGGMSRGEAAKALRAELSRRSEQLKAPVELKIGEQTAKVKPADVGLTVDVDATVAAAVATSPGPLRLLFGSQKLHPVVRVDAARLDAKLQKVAGKVGEAMTMPAVRFDGTTPRPVYPKPGKGLDQERSAQALREAWPSRQPVVVPLVDIHPATSAEDVNRLIAELAKPAVAAPVTVTTQRGEFTIPPTAIAKSLILTADKTGKINPRVDEKKLRAALASQLASVEVKPKDARMSLAGSRPRVVSSTTGRVLDTAKLSTSLLPVLARDDGREVKGVVKAVKPELTTEELAGLGIKERVSTFTTRFTGGLSSPRSQNIVLASKEVDGAIVKPGKVFSLNGHTGERGKAQGYQEAPVILHGKLVPGVGGGISQFTTTLFNASYYAGLEDVEHKPHSYYFSRYPPVIESTIYYPDLDFKFRNNTQHGVLIDTSYTSDSITVSMWSTKVYDSVTTKWSERRNITKPKTIYLKPGPDCIETDGIDGFTQDAWRIFRKGGKEIKREKFTWTYDPEPRYVCQEKPPATQKPPS